MRVYGACAWPYPLISSLTEAEECAGSGWQLLHPRSPILVCAHSGFLHFQVLLWGCLARIPQCMFDAVIQMSSVRPRTWYATNVSPTLSRSLGEPLPSSLHARILPLGSSWGLYAGREGCPHILRGPCGGASESSASKAISSPSLSA
jgi:hypothetical protein